MRPILTSALIGFLAVSSFEALAQTKSAKLPDDLKLLLTTAAKDPAKLKVMREMMIEAYPALETAIITFSNTLGNLKEQKQEPVPVKKPAQDVGPCVPSTPVPVIEKKPTHMPFFDAKLWNLQVELGASFTAGDAASKSLALGIGLNRKFGEKWEHNLDADVVFAETNGVSTTEQYVAKHEMLWRPWKKVFVLNFIQAEKNVFSGFDMQIIENLGIGYQLYNKENIQWRIDAGPGVRYSKFTNGMDAEKILLGRIASDLKWKISDNFLITDKMSFVLADGATVMENKTELTSKFNSSLAARLSYQLKYDSASPAGTTKWDSISRITLVYDF